MWATTEQIEFENLPPRRGLAPLEDAGELEQTLEILMRPLTSAQRLEACQQLISAALRGEPLHVLNEPPHIYIGQRGGEPARIIKLTADTTVHAVLNALMSVVTIQN